MTKLYLTDMFLRHQWIKKKRNTQIAEEANTFFFDQEPGERAFPA